jgi:hypothetical protein
VGGGIGLDVFQPVFGQRQFLVAPDGTFHKDRMSS